ncbi:MAG TPA: SAF domain-containing protein [Clostridia bacterium]|nr:SAF domain-containing protein [Clostridia bacterium]
MKNRTVIGIICMILAVAITFGVAPMVNRMMGDTTTVIRLSVNIKQGAQITAEQIETAEVKTDTLPTGVITQKSEVIGKYAVSALYAGDYFTAAKLTVESNSAEDV